MGIEALIHFVIYFIVLGLIIGALLYLVSIAPIPEPFKTWLWFFVIAVAVLIVVFYVLLPMLGAPPTLKLGR